MGAASNRPATYSGANNLVVLTGTITTPLTRRELRSGDVVNFDISTAVDDGPPLSVPVAWYDPSAAAVSGLDDGLEVLVAGVVRRRFFRVGGQTQSRTEVVLETVVPTRRVKSMRSALAAAAGRLMPTDG